MARTPANYFTDSGQPSFGTEARTGKWEREFAFGSLEPTALIFHASHQQLDNAYARPSDQNLANYNLNGRIAYFCDDTAFRDLGANISEWTREVATLPQNFNDAESYSYAFPGYYLGRQSATKAPTSKIVKEFFLVGNTAAGANYNTALEIPQFYAQNYAWAYLIGGSDVVELTGYLSNSNANFFGAVIIGSNPNLATYQGWAAGDAATPQNFTIEAADSVIEHLRGPIWQRTRRFVKAQ